MEFNNGRENNFLPLVPNLLIGNGRMRSLKKNSIPIRRLGYREKKFKVKTFTSRSQSPDWERRILIVLC